MERINTSHYFYYANLIKSTFLDKTNRLFSAIGLRTMCFVFFDIQNFLDSKLWDFVGTKNTKPSLFSIGLFFAENFECTVSHLWCDIQIKCQLQVIWYVCHLAYNLIWFFLAIYCKHRPFYKKNTNILFSQNHNSFKNFHAHNKWEINIFLVFLCV